MRLAVTRRPASCRSCPLRRRKDLYRPIVTHRKSSITASYARRDGKSRRRRRRERYWRRSLTTLPLFAWRPSRIVPVYVYVTDVYSRHAERTPVSRAVEEPWRRRRQRRRRRRRHARGRDRHVSSHVLAGAMRREATRSRRKPKAQASVLPMYDGCPSARIRRQDSI